MKIYEKIMKKKYKIQLNDGLGWYDDRSSTDDGMYEIVYFLSKDSAYRYIAEDSEFYEDKAIQIVSENVSEEWTPYENELLA